MATASAGSALTLKSASVDPGPTPESPLKENDGLEFSYREEDPACLRPR
jgi:hypothetical protein